MKKPRTLPMKVLQRRAQSSQISMVFDSIRLRGLSSAERTKVLTYLANLLLLAGEVVAKENADER